MHLGIHAGVALATLVVRPTKSIHVTCPSSSFHRPRRFHPGCSNDLAVFGSWVQFVQFESVGSLAALSGVLPGAEKS